MKKYLIILLVFVSFKSFSQTTPRHLLGKDLTTNMPRFYNDTLRTIFYKNPLYVIGDSVYFDSTHFYLWQNTGRTVRATLTSNYGVGTDTARGKFEVAVNGIGAPSTPDDSLALVLANNTQATAITTYQLAPAIRFRSHFWTGIRDTMYDYKIQPVANGLSFVGRLNGVGSYSTYWSMVGQNFAGGASTTVTATNVTATTQVAGTYVIAQNATFNTSIVGILSNAASNATATSPVKYSPWIGMSANVWDSASSLAKTVVFGTEVRPVSLASNPTGSWYLWSNVNSGGIVDRLRVRSDGAFFFNATNTATGTTGAQTINKTSGTVNIAASGTAVTVTNNLVATTSLVFAVIRTNDATARIANVVPSAGSFVINLTAATTAETSIGFWVIN